MTTTQNNDFSNTQGQLTLQSEVELIRDIIDIFVTSKFVTSKNKEDLNKNEGARVATTLNIDFSHSQGHITLQSWVGSG